MFQKIPKTMLSFPSPGLLILLVCPTVLGFQFGNSLERDHFDENIDGISNFSDTSSKAIDELTEVSSGNYGYYNIASEYRSDSGSSSANESTTVTGSTGSSGYDLSHSQSTEYPTSEPSSANVSSVNQTETASNESHTYSEEYSSSESSAIANGRTQSGRKSTLFFVTPSSETKGSSSQSDEETEGVVIGRPSNASGSTVNSQPKTIYQKTLELISDTYTLSILVPVAAGIIFASTIIVTIATCRCFRRRCRRRRLRKKVLPDSVKNLRPSDRARLLAESSDEEF